jgi:hypothetical protein
MALTTMTMKAKSLQAGDGLRKKEKRYLAIFFTLQKEMWIPLYACKEEINRTRWSTSHA